MSKKPLASKASNNTPGPLFDPNHDAMFQYALLAALVLLIIIITVWGNKLDTTQNTYIGMGIGVIAALLKQTHTKSNKEKNSL